MRDDIKKLIELAVYAPSGDNIQPWKFEVKKNKIFIYNQPNKDTTLYNYKQRGSYIAHGALIENLLISAPSFGYQAEASIFPDKTNPDLTCEITLNPAINKNPNNLFEFIKLRCTNRKIYKPTQLNDTQKNQLINLDSNQYENIKIQLMEDKKQIQLLSEALSSADRLIFENKTIHDFLFSHIRWTEKEEQINKNGLYLKTMELKPPQILAFKLFKKWSVMKFFNSLNFPKLAVKSNIKLYSQCAAIGTIIAPGSSNRDYINTGRALQKLWLTATKQGLSLQPLTAIPFLIQKVFDKNTNELEPYQAKIIKNSYQRISNIFNVGEKTLTFMFRIGYSDKPSAYSSRLTPEITWQN